MGNLRTHTDGKPKPQAGARIKVINGTGFKGQIVWVTAHPGTARDGIVVSNIKSAYHGHYCTEWEELSVAANFDSDVRQALANEAWESAKKHGYCKEAKKVLEDLGLPAPVENETWRLTVEKPKGASVEVFVNGKKVAYKGTNLADEEW